MILANPDAIDLPLKQIVQDCVSVAERDGELVGFAVVLRRADGDAELDGLFVEPSVWREGIGSQLVREAERRASRDGAKTLRVTANRAAETFYSACGFIFVGTEQTRFGIARTMAKTLIATARTATAEKQK